ncbi:uncharacterized protein [Rutidosis leptorrhynchoides]
MMIGRMLLAQLMYSFSKIHQDQLCKGNSIVELTLDIDAILALEYILIVQKNQRCLLGSKSLSELSMRLGGSASFTLFKSATEKFFHKNAYELWKLMGDDRDLPDGLYQ